MREILRQALSKRKKRYLVEASRIPAAVLLLIYWKQGEYHILFTRRTDKVKSHKGQMSFPGGAYEEGDRTLLDTALRETAEEIGLTADRIEILGELDDILTVTSDYVVSPFVATMSWPYPFELDRWEVEEIVEVPVAVLLGKARLYPDTETVDNEIFGSYSYYFQGRVIWGATAEILHQFLGIWSKLKGDIDAEKAD